MGLHLIQRTELLEARGRHFHQHPAVLRHAGATAADDAALMDAAGLCQLALERCGALSAGISMILDGTPDVIIRCAVGELARTQGLVFPFEQSPCGVCAATGVAQLFVQPHRHFLWMAEANIFVREWLVAPLCDSHGAVTGTLWVTSGEHDAAQFDQTDQDTLQQIAALAAALAIE